MESKVAYLCSSQSWGGLEMNHFRNALWMQEHGVDVVVFAIEGSPLAESVKMTGLPLVLIRKHRKYYDYLAAYSLVKLFRENKITHLFIRDTRDMSVAGLTKLFLRNQLQVAYFMEMQLGINKKDLLHTIRFSRLDYWFCPLEWLKNQVLEKTRFPAKKTHVLPSGIDVSQFKDSLSRQEARKRMELPENLIIFGLIGRFDPQKGQLLALKAFKDLKNANIGLVFLGEKTKNESDYYFEEIKSLIKRCDLQNKVFIRPFRKDISIFFTAIDATIMASKSETFGMVTIESMAAGVPVIGSESGGTVELLQHGKLGYLFKPEDQKSLTEKMNEFLKNPMVFEPTKLTNSMETFNYSNIVNQIVNICKIK